jgi:hypothetical protein
LVHTTMDAPGVQLDRSDGPGHGRGRVNVLLIFLEGLDRRFLGLTVRGPRDAVSRPAPR